MKEEKTLKILIVGLDEILFEVCRQAWQNENGILYGANDLSECMKMVANSKYHLISCVLPDDETEKLSFIKQLRVLRGMTAAPIVVYRHGTYTPELKVKILEEGADDFQLCPPTMEEAVAVSKSLIRRYTDLNNRDEKPVTIVYGENIIITTEQHKVFVNGKEVELSPKEFDILCMLMKNPGRVFTYEQIFQEVWGEEYRYSARKNLRTHVEKLRKKLQTADNLPEFIKTHHSIGYSFVNKTT